MRILKFRAWNKEENKMQEFELDYIYDDGKIMFDDGEMEGHLVDLQKCEIMQYTGLKDKNGGKDIYEGDIIKFSFIDNSIKERLLPVIWDEKSAGFICKNLEHSMGVDMTTNNTVKGEVIGNIYQNKELIK